MALSPRTGVTRLFRTEDPAVGDRVVVRRRVPGSDHEVTDVIGHVLNLDPLEVRPQEVGGLPSDAASISVPAEAVVAVRLLPERTVRNGEIRAVEVATARAFPGARHTLSADGQWLMRAGDGITERSNSAAPLGRRAGFFQPPMAEIDAFYRAHGLPVVLQIPERIARPVERMVSGPDWRLGPEVLVMTRPLAGAAPQPPAAHLPAGFSFRVDQAPDDEWLSLYHFRGRALPGHALELLRTQIDGIMAFGRVTAPDGTTAAITRGTVTADDAGRDWLGLSAVEVAPQCARRGLGRAVVSGMLAWGADHGAGQAFLQVVHTNTAGVALYRCVGFHEHHRHRYAHRLT